MSKVISKEDLDDCRAWEMPAVESSAPEETGRPGVRKNSNLLTASQIEEVQRQAYEEAYAAGLREGRDAGRREMQDRAQQLDRLMCALAAPFEELDDEVEQELASLAIAMVRQLVRRELKSEPGQVIAVVREAMAILPAASRHIRLHLHPEDAALVREALSLSDEERSWKVVDDPVLGRGGCRVVTEHSQVDASVESRVAQLIAKIFGGERESDEPA